MTDDKPQEEQAGNRGINLNDAAPSTVSHVIAKPASQSGMHHWRRSTTTDTSQKRRDGVFFAIVEMTRMPIVFANNAFFDLTGYEFDEIVGRNCRSLQGSGYRPSRRATATRGHC